MAELSLVKPSKEYQASFKKYVLSYKTANDEYYFNKYHQALENFDDYIKKLNLASTQLTDEFDVITSTFWLISGEDIVGVVRVRHEEVGTAGHIGYDISPCYRGKGFGTCILRLALIEAGKIGISEAIATCSVDNTYSRKIIEKNNGRLLGTVYDAEDDEYYYKYSFKIKN